MARSDLLLTLVRSGSQGHRLLFRKAVEALIAEERAQQHHVLAAKLDKVLKENGGPEAETTRRVEESVQKLFFEVHPRKSLSDLILPASVASACQELVEEQHRANLLRSHNLEPRHRVLLAGPPGNGKTSLAEALADALMVPLVSVRYEGVVGSFLGETASRLGRLFDFVRGKRCVLFFDEFDTLGKERGDPHDTGEIKRVVSSLLLQIDDLPSYVVVVTATNHPELLDRAVWRRFQILLELPRPTRPQIESWFKALQQKFDFELGYSPGTFSKKLHGRSFAELEDFSADVIRRWVLSGPSCSVREIVRQRLKQWTEKFKPNSPTPRTRVTANGP